MVHFTDFEHNGQAIMYKLVFFVPETHAEAVKRAVFATGAGKIGDYDQCCFETPGQGQFRPLAEASPFLGEAGKLERVNELRIELVCEDHLIRDAVNALRKAHPYEEPAYDVWPLTGL
ncbi:YqfO family protein [Oceanimonas sp. NS1]|nr:YqfO family protein [Oceanimonas sp. NS1]